MASISISASRTGFSSFLREQGADTVAWPVRASATFALPPIRYDVADATRHLTRGEQRILQQALRRSVKVLHVDKRATD